MHKDLFCFFSILELPDEVRKAPTKSNPKDKFESITEVLTHLKLNVQCIQIFHRRQPGSLSFVNVLVAR